MLRKIYQELVKIRKELQAIRSSKEFAAVDIKSLTKGLNETIDSVSRTLRE